MIYESPLLMKQLKITSSITTREDMSLEKYLQDIAKIDLLEPEEEVVLAKTIREWGYESNDAIYKLCRANLRFVVSVAKQYQWQWLSLSDLINEWNMWLIKAAKRFDETRWFKFISYAVRRIRQSILQAIAEHSKLIRVPLNKVGSIKKILDTTIEFEQTFEREPTTDELAKMLGTTELSVRESLFSYQRHISLDAPLASSEDGDATLLTVLSDTATKPTDENLSHTESLQVEIQSALNGLPWKQFATILELYYWLNGHKSHSLEEIGEVFNISRERARQLKEKGIRLLVKKAKIWKLDNLRQFIAQ